MSRGSPSAWSAFAFEGGAASVALDVHLEDGGVVDEAVDDGERHRLIGEDFSPFAEGLVGGDQQGSPLVSGTDEFEQDAGFGLILADIGEVVEDQQVVLVELGDGGFESEFGRAICSRWTRSVVRVNRTRQPFSTRAKPRADAK